MYGSRNNIRYGLGSYKIFDDVQTNDDKKCPILKTPVDKIVPD